MFMEDFAFRRVTSLSNMGFRQCEKQTIVDLIVEVGIQEFYPTDRTHDQRNFPIRFG